MVLEACLVWHVQEPSRLLVGQSPACLDLILTKSEQPVSLITLHEPIGKSDNLIVLARLNLLHSRDLDRTPRRNIWKADLASMRREAESSDWFLLGGDLVESSWSSLRDKLKSLCEKFSPLRYNTRKPTLPPWDDQNFRQLARRRKKLWLKYRNTTDARAYVAYKNQHNLCKSS
ncbi:unnamed protein product [Dicrocoelium dendriticum]|nr:unnamed protein product [Dicrocoelium dendriticum]